MIVVPAEPMQRLIRGFNARVPTKVPRYVSSDFRVNPFNDLQALQVNRTSRLGGRLPFYSFSLSLLFLSFIRQLRDFDFYGYAVMSIKRATEWRKLPMSLSELCIDTTLRCGQSFRWRKISDEWLVLQ